MLRCMGVFTVVRLKWLYFVIVCGCLGNNTCCHALKLWQGVCVVSSTIEPAQAMETWL